MIIQDGIGFNPHSLLIVNAISLVAFAVAFFFAWLKQRDKAYWLFWMGANLILACSSVLFATLDNSQVAFFALANCLLFLGVALRWQAIRLFFHAKSSGTIKLIVATLFVIAAFFATNFSYGFIFGAVNTIMFVQILLIIYELLRNRTENLPSRWSLVFAYGIICISFALRIFQSWFFGANISSLLPQDILLVIHILLASVHIVASGTFALSMAYERGVSELSQMALRDPLTELYNRRAFELNLSKLKPSDGTFALILIDIDHFKRINDEFGHIAGDIALQRCAYILTRIFRKTDFIARIGGEEFVVILPNTSLQEAFEFAENVRQTVEEDAFDHGNRVVRLTISAGVCQATAGETCFADIIKKADTSLYFAKNNGRNRVEMIA